MEDAWTLYPIIRDGVPGMMMVDAELSDQVPIPGLNVVAIASLEIGVGDRAEDVNGLEDDLAERIAGAGGRFVGHVRSSTELLAVGYLPELPADDEAWHRGWTNLHFLEDPEWEMFGVCLSVGPQEEQALHDLQVFMALAEQGDLGRKSRPVDHQASFADPASARSFVESVQSHGFNQTDWKHEPDSVEVQVTRRDPVLPPPAGISEVVWLVRQRAETHQGTYLGWGAHVVAPKKNWWRRTRRRPRTVLLLGCLVVLSACAEPSGDSDAAESTPSSSAKTFSSSVTPGNESVTGEVSCSISGDQPFPVVYLEGPELSPEEFSATALGASFAGFFENGPGAPEGGIYRQATGFSIVSESLVLGYQGQLPSAMFIVDDGMVRRWGGCLPNLVSDGLVAARWQLAAPVAAHTTTLEIAVEGGACVTKSGNDIVTEVVGSDVVEDVDTVTVTVWTREEPLQGWCAGVGIMLRSSVELQSPLNGRTLLNGGPVPPQKVELTAIQLEPPEDDDSSLGRLHCAPSTVGEQLVADIGQDPQDIIKRAVPSVVEVEPGQPLWWWGIDKDGEVVAALALGDMDGAHYQLWTCQD